MAENVAGRTRLAGLFELIQVCETHRRNVAISVNQKNRLGRIFIQDGILADAVYDDMRGDDAVVEILRWLESYFELLPLRGPVERTIRSSTVNLLIAALKGMGHVDLPASRTADTIVGSLGLLSSTELLQLYEMNHRSAFMMLRNDAGVGTVHLRDGKAIHATLGQTQGDDAVLGLLLWQHGYFRIRYSEEYVFRTVTDPIRSLVMEATRRSDEKTRRGTIAATNGTHAPQSS